MLFTVCGMETKVIHWLLVNHRLHQRYATNLAGPWRLCTHVRSDIYPAIQLPPLPLWPNPIPSLKVRFCWLRQTPSSFLRDTHRAHDLSGHDNPAVRRSLPYWIKYGRLHGPAPRVAYLALSPGVYFPHGLGQSRLRQIVFHRHIPSRIVRRLRGIRRNICFIWWVEYRIFI